MASSRPDRLTPLQSDLLVAFFAHEQRFVLTGGAALAGFYFHHRETEDLDLFGSPGIDLDQASRALRAAALSCGAELESVETYPDFRRYRAIRQAESCLVDLVVDRAPRVDLDKARFGTICVDTLREIAANKACTLVGRAEAKDLVDFKFLIDSGANLAQALADAERKDAGVDPATLAWVLGQWKVGAGADLPGGVDPAEMERFRQWLIQELRALAFEVARTRGQA